ncbi:MAG: hypothetical protein RLZZ444_2158 [Pseudomonadota bacterium]
MRRPLQILVSFVCVLTTMSIAAAAIPGPQRMLAPRLYGMTEIAPGVFSDRPERSDEKMAAIRHAEEKMRGFFGTLKATPRYVLCSEMRCEKTFGFNGNTAQAFGWQIVHLPPRAFAERGLDRILMTHELFHAELLVRWGPTALWDEKIPNWFNEGMASYLSDDHRISLFQDEETKAWIRKSRGFYDWSTFLADRGWKRAYGAAAANVADIDHAIGKDGLLKLIDRTIAGEDFDAVLAEMKAHRSR